VDEYAAIAEQGQRTLRAAVHRDVPAVVADRWLLRRVLANLVVNAIRHSGGDVLVDATASAREVTLRVTDSGRGIPTEDQALIFEKFRSGGRAAIDEPARDTRLGLPFCKLAVESMGGRITLASQAGRTVFAVTLPAQDATPLAPGRSRFSEGLRRQGASIRTSRGITPGKTFASGDMVPDDYPHSAEATIKDLMTRSVVSVRLDTSIAALAALLSAHPFNGLPVIDED